MASAADVPDKFDVVINGQGYMFDASFDPSVVYRTQKASYGYTPTFVERSNVQGNFGDDQQAFWMTASQNDWSLGDSQEFFRSTDADSIRKFQTGANLDCSTIGQVTPGPGVYTSVLVGNIAAMGSGNSFGLVATATNLYTLTGDTSTSLLATDLGAHGAGAPQADGVCSDLTSLNYYVNGATKIRKYTGGVWSDFSAAPAVGTNAGIFYLNNALYGWDDANLYTWSSAGARTTIFTWKDASGGTPATVIKAVPYGSKIAVLAGYDASATTGGAYAKPLSVWIYDGASTTMVWRLPPALGRKADICEAFGDLFVGATTADYTRDSSSGGMSQGFRTTVFRYNGSSFSLLWRSPNSNTGGADLYTSICPHQRGVFVNDLGSQQVYRIDLDTGGAYPYADAGYFSIQWMVRGGGSNAHVYFAKDTGQATVRGFGLGGVTASSTLTTSNFDFESSLLKVFRGIKIDGASPAGSFAISYSVDGAAFVSLANPATPGLEYSLTGVSGHTIRVMVTITTFASITPLVRRIYVRAAPLQDTFRTASYILDCSGNKDNPTKPGLVTLRNGASHSKDGQDMANDLVTAVTTGAPVSITDRFGTFAGIIEPAQFELHEVRSNYGRGEYRALVTVRQT